MVYPSTTIESKTRLPVGNSSAYGRWLLGLKMRSAGSHTASSTSAWATTGNGSATPKTTGVTTTFGSSTLRG